MKKRILALLLALALLMSLAACSDDESWEDEDTEEQSAEDGGASDVDGGLTIERPSRDEEIPMGEDGTWTIFVYLCGTDLESDGGMASMDLEEMCSADTGENVRFIVQTGGTSAWESDIDASVCQRYEICGGEMTLVDEGELTGMGLADTLTSFLEWGVGNYPAANMGLVFWDHGGGSISGVCFDELDDSDSLSLSEIDEALGNVYGSMTDKFAFIGFDACLMGTVECANVLASYADYMLGSEELEPGYGWDYYMIGSMLGYDPEMDGEALGQIIADSFYDACDAIGAGDEATMSVVDLSKIDAVMQAFNLYAKNLYSATEDASVLAQTVRSAVNADNFGGNNKSEGYTNMVDLAGIVQAGADYADGADAVLSAIEDAVIYKRMGTDHEDACGLAIYYPLEIQGSMELGIFSQVAISPYYLAFVDRAAHGAVGVGEYDNEEAMQQWQSEEASDYYSYYDDYEQTGESAHITFDAEPALDEDGSYGFTLSEEGLTQAASVQANVYMLSNDEADLIELGVSVYINADWETGEFSDAFDGCWFSLPDGQVLAVYVVSECDGYDIYTSPVMLNGEETNLRLTHDYTTGEITIDGVWDGVDENGMASREVTSLSSGDEIVPLYYAMAIESDEEYTYYGESYTFDGEPEITYSYLPDGEFFYGFWIDDIYGDYYATDYVQFSVEGEDVYFYTE